MFVTLQEIFGRKISIAIQVSADNSQYIAYCVLSFNSGRGTPGKTVFEGIMEIRDYLIAIII